MGTQTTSVGGHELLDTTPASEGNGFVYKMGTQTLSGMPSLKIVRLCVPN
jgi:hypothetical protein